MDVSKIVRIIFIVWLVLWINFTARDFYKKGYAKDYLILLERDAEGKRSYTYGDHFYEFLKFSKDNIPENATYNFSGVEAFSLALKRAIYYMYPSIESKTPDFILVYDAPGYSRAGYVMYKTLDDDRYILKRV